MRKVYCSVIAVITMVNAAVAQTQRVGSATAQASSGSAEVAILKAQLDVMRDCDARLLSTVHWALTVLVTVFFILLGYNWVVNFRQYQRDKDDAEKALKEGLETVKQAMRIEIQRELPKMLSAAEKAGEKASKSLREYVEEEFAEIRLNDAVREAQMWREQKVFANSIRRTCDAIVLICDAGLEVDLLDFQLGNQLSLLREDIKSITGSLLGPDTASVVLGALAKLPATYAIEVEGLKRLVGEKRSQS